MIQLRNLEKRYQTRAGFTYVLRQIHLDVDGGDFITFMGPSGAGKSTLLSILGMFDGEFEGEYHFNGQAVHELKPKDRAALNKQHVGFVFQQFHLLDDMTVAENLKLPLSYRDLKKPERQSLVADTLDRFGIVAKKDLFPSQLSGGQQQLVAIARAIIAKPALIQADERRASEPAVARPVIAKTPEAGEGFTVFGPVCRHLARNDVVRMANRETVHDDAPLPGIFEALDSVRRKHQVQIEGAVLQLNEVFAAFDFSGLAVVELETQFAQRVCQGASVVRSAVGEDVGVLRRVRIAKNDRSRFADEEITDTVTREGVADFLRLPVFKRAHSRANPGGSAHTTGDSPPCSRTSDSAHRRAPVCRFEQRSSETAAPMGDAPPPRTRPTNPPEFRPLHSWGKPTERIVIGQDCFLARAGGRELRALPSSLRVPRLRGELNIR
jgi:putative ABC transport system ATP-binding protein